MNPIYEFTLRYWINDPLAADVGLGPQGSRIVYRTDNGSIEGERINARLVEAMGTTVIGPDGWGRFDARSHFVTDDGATLYITFDGFVEINEKTLRSRTHGEGTEWADQKLQLVMRDESGHPAYSWLNHTLFVGEDHFLPKGVEYKVYQLN
jgi:hypothetical protein